jgi:hypothetical protein
MAISQDVIRAAWAAEKDGIEASFPISPVAPVLPATEPTQAANALALPNYDAKIGDLGLCPNSGMGGVWRLKGGTTLTLSDMKVWSFQGVKAGDPSFPDGNTVILPIKFSLIEVRGRYHIHCTCALSSMWGSEIQSSDKNETGSMTQTFSAGTLDYALDISGPGLRFKSVSIPGTPSVVTQSDSGLPKWLAQLGNVMSGRDILGAINNAMGNVFATAGFAQSMIASLDKRMEQ